MNKELIAGLPWGGGTVALALGMTLARNRHGRHHQLDRSTKGSPPRGHMHKVHLALIVERGVEVA